MPPRRSWVELLAIGVTEGQGIDGFARYILALLEDRPKFEVAGPFHFHQVSQGTTDQIAERGVAGQSDSVELLLKAFGDSGGNGGCTLFHGEVVMRRQLGSLGLKRLVSGKLTGLQRGIERDQGIHPRVVQMPAPKLGYPARGKQPTTGSRERGVRCLAGPKPLTQTSKMAFNVHGENISKKLLDEQVTNCLTPGLTFKGMKKSPREILAGNVVRLREARGWSQTQLGRIAGMTQTTISAIERCVIDTSIEKVELLAKAFNLPMWALLLHDVDEGMFKGNGLGEVVEIFPVLQTEGRTEILRIAERERRYINSVAKLPPHPHPTPNTA